MTLKHPSCFNDRFALFDKQHIYWLIPIALLAAGCVLWRVPFTIFWEIALLGGFSTLPGMLLLSRFRMNVSLLERFVLGTAIGFGVTPLVFKALAFAGLWQHASLVISLMNVLVLALLVGRHNSAAKTPEQAQRSQHRGQQLIWLCTLAVAITLLYNFAGIHYTSDGRLIMRGLFAIDVPFLIGMMPSFDLYGHLADMHQGGLAYAYHDFTYALIAVVHQIAGTDYFSLIAYSFPVFGYSLVSIALFAFLSSFTDRNKAVWLTIDAMLISSIWGDHLLTGALSPSYLAGLVLLIALLIVGRDIVEGPAPNGRNGLIGLMFVLLVILIKTKLPIYLLAGGSFGLLGLIHLRKDRDIAQGLVLPCLLSVPFVLLFSEANPYQPAGDFVIGAPLMGYANQLASLLHIQPSSIDPVIEHLDFEVEDLLIPLYTIIHLLRIVLLDARLLLFVIAVVCLRNNMRTEQRWLLWFGGSAMALGVILPILYSPAWYPLAISFYTPDLAGFACVLIAMLLIKTHWQQLSKFAMVAIILCVFYGGMSISRHVVAQITAQEYSLSMEEVQALDWIKHHTPADATIASNRYDLDLSDSTNDESFYLYGAIAQRRIVSSGAKYGSLLAAVADYDSVKGLQPVVAATTALTQRRMDVFTMYRSLNPELVARTLDAYSVDYVLATRDPRTSQLDLPNAQKQFETVIKSNELPVLRFKR